MRYCINIVTLNLLRPKLEGFAFNYLWTPGVKHKASNELIDK